jgi:hypothetical protein
MLSGNSGHSEYKLKQKIIEMRDSMKIPKIRKMMQEEEILSRSQRSSKSQGSKGSHGSSRGKMTSKYRPVQKERSTLEWPDINSLKNTVQISPLSKDTPRPNEFPIEYLKNPPTPHSQVPTTLKQPRSEWVRSKKERLTTNDLNPSVLPKRKGALNCQTKIEASMALPKTKVNFLIRRKSCDCKNCGGGFSKYKMMINAAINIEEHVNELDIEPNGDDASKLACHFGQKSTRGIDFAYGDEQSEDPDNFEFGASLLPVSKSNVYKMSPKKSVTGTWGLTLRLDSFQGSSMQVPNTMRGKEKCLAHQHTCRGTGDSAKFIWKKVASKSLNRLCSNSVIPEDLVRSEVFDHIPMDCCDDNCDGHKSRSRDRTTTN